MRRAHIFAALCILFGGIFTPAAATSNYTYGPDEYAIVDGGLSRGGKYSIAAHGNGEGGNDDFHLYLMAEPGHRRIGLLKEVESRLDTGPEAFAASWSEDSLFVALGYRLERHLYAINNIYRVADGRADPVQGPSLLKAIGVIAADHPGNDDFQNVDFRDVDEQLTWLGPGRFRLSGHGTLRITPEIAQTLTKYGKQIDATAPRQDGFVFFEYSVEAECEIEGYRYKILSLKP